MALYTSSLKAFRKDKWGYATISIIGQSCLGSIAAMFVLINGNGLIQMLQLFLVTVACMLFNAAVLSQRKSELVFKLLLASILTSTLLILLNAF
ncbi:hypothetical protein [Spongiimicrobium sp. 2-473A-2-J]|uniref:hypothetical protein n=1 Tax=Eudoraea algarum TaxID=3417568 RepID=UPI003D35DE97